MQWPTRWSVLGVAAAVVAGLATGSSSATEPERQERDCQAQQIPVSLHEGGPADQEIYGELCLPAGKRPKAVMLLTHGITYDHNYFDIPGFDEQYSYAASAAEAGYATLSIDRIGSGNSSHPPASLIGMNTNVWIAHQLVQKLRAGKIASSNGKVAFAKVLQVGHSYGSGVTWLEASRYKDVDAIIVTGANHFPRVDTITQTLVPSLVSAPLDPAFSGEGLDPAYLTTRPGTRYADFMAPGNVDPALVAQDERLKQTVTASEFAQIPFDIGTELDIDVPVLVALGDKDSLFCGAGADCSSEEELVASEAPKLGYPPCVDGYLQPGAGHDNVLMRNARDFFDALNAWALETVPPDGSTRTGGCGDFDPKQFKTIDPGAPNNNPIDPLQQLGTGLPAGPVLNVGGQALENALRGFPSDVVMKVTP
ncbi:alpha/beta hydrolase [Prauserella flavalba]|uniref:alpha/beta hydrolase n=1 Tax=Prauserella flavalba TaxID=1477506 RepID=UPI0036EA72A9